jgi:hypothetical protein
VRVRNRFVGRRDWLEYPNAWKGWVVFAVLWAFFATVYLIDTNPVGLGYLVLAVGACAVARYAYRRSRPGRSGNDVR